MNLSNYYCDHIGCSNEARVLGLSTQSIKRKACGNHVLGLIDKHMSVYDIAGFSFINSIEDGTAYLHRKEQVRKGLDSITVLERRLNSDLEAAKERLQSGKAAQLALLEQSYQEMECTLCRQFETLQQQLLRSRSNFESFLTEKDFLLSPEETALCSDASSVHCIGLVLGDCALAVVDAVMASFHVLPIEGQKMMNFAREQMEKGRIDLVKEACIYIQRLGLESPYPNIDSISLTYTRKAERKLIHLLPVTATDHQLQSAAEAYLVSGLQAIQAGNYDKYLRKLQRGRVLLQSKSLENPILSKDLGFALTHFGKWEEANLTLRQGLEYQQRLDPSSELAVQLSNGIGEAYYQAGKWQEAVTRCEFTLEHWGNTAHTFELLRAVYFLTNSYYYLEHHEKGFDLVDKMSVAETPPSRCILRLIQVEKMRLQKNPEVLTLYEQAVAQAIEVLPNSFMTAYALRCLSRIYEIKRQVQAAEEHYLQACKLFAIHFPYCFSYVQCLENSGYLSQNFVGNADKAEECYSIAYGIAKEHYPETKTFAYCLLSLGLLHKDKGSKEEAIPMLESSMELYRQAGDLENTSLCESSLNELRRQ